MTTFYAQPYDIHASGFYFDDAESYLSKIGIITNEFGDLVEEFDIQFLDGEWIDAELATAIGVNQANVLDVMAAMEGWGDHQKTLVILAAGECGYAFDPADDDPDGLDVDIYPVSSLRELAEHFVEEGLFGEISEQLGRYLDYDAIARDLSVDYTETSVAGESLIYRCG
ncbi:antirestriction protein ArdA [Thalassococcus sp. S3]|uniref:antirestriction protein ArdA n=1 Tax=Thalassococcus sp. S3 TaxID=2017482 RepID=UPI0010249218|nr:antirestriction protein ArdA [Thalassococcus sp. S3]QBF30077.1 antirestriction protein ArdA [Thalassococcus sp. S3]